MNEINFHIVTRKDLFINYPMDAWDDSELNGLLSPEKIKAILNNPIKLDDNAPVQIIALYGNKLIGRIDILNGEVSVNSTQETILWLSSWVVSPAYRHMGAGILMIFHLQNLGYTLGSCNVSQMAYPIYKKLKWHEFELSRLILVQKSQSILNRYIGSWKFMKIIEKIFDSLFLFQKIIIKNIMRIRSNHLIVSPFSEGDLNDFSIALSADSVESSFHRSVEWIKWLLDSNYANSSIFKKDVFIVRDRDNKLAGYFLIKQTFYDVASQKGLKNLMLASIQDWKVFDKSMINEFDLIILSINQIFKWNADAIEVCSNNARLLLALRWIGLIRAGKLSIFIKPSRKSTLSFKNSSLQTILNVRPVEGDNFFT